MTAALFNGVCSRCSLFKPRCAAVVADGREQIYCEDCRRLCKGTFKLHEKHRRRRKDDAGLFDQEGK